MYLDGIFDMFDWFKKSQKTPPPVVEKVAKPKVVEPPPKTEKQIATEAGEPWVQVLSIEVDPNNLHQGAFELDWNEIFVRDPETFEMMWVDMTKVARVIVNEMLTC